jgi:hypothetical protein
VWFGNFACGWTNEEGVFPHPDGQRLVVIASGFFYEVDPVRPESVPDANLLVTGVWQLSNGDLLLANSGITLKRWGANGERWDSGRLSTDGFQDIQVEDDRVVGKGWNYATDRWHPFEVDIKTGEAVVDADDARSWRARLTKVIRHVRPSL